MADIIGAMPLPIPAPVDDDDVVSDPLLKYALSFFQAVINRYGSAAWDAVAKGSGGKPVKKTRAYDPINISFLELDLPCLYMWREEGTEADWLSEDILCYRSKVHVLWVIPPTDDEKQKKRVPFINGVLKTLAMALALGRDPAWVVPGDPDPQAATHGSVFVRWAGISGYSSPRWKRKVFVVSNDQAHEKYPFQALETVIEIEEILEEDISKYPLLQGVDVTQATDADPDGTITGVVTEHALLT